jgi:hypothetical protein
LSQQEIKERELREKVETITMTIQVPVLKYRALMELARKTETESLKFIKGYIPFKCPTTADSVPGVVCPVGGESDICKKYVFDFVDAKYGSDISQIVCYGAFMKWLFSEV